MRRRLEIPPHVVESYYRRILKGATVAGEQITARCPLHGDRKTKSFSANLRTGQWTCHGKCADAGNLVQFVSRLEGCSLQEAEKQLRDAGSWEVHSSSPPRREDPFAELASRPEVSIPQDEASPAAPVHVPSKQRAIAATYDYVDLQGRVVFQVVRYEPKDFRQRRPLEGNSAGWDWRVPRELRTIPYRWPSVRAALRKDGTVWLVEGEKDVDACNAAFEALGMKDHVATTYQGGAGAWADENRRDLMKSRLEEGRLFCVPDRDEQGSNMAQAVLELFGDRVTFYAVKQGKDLSDHLEAGRSVVDLDQVTHDEIRDGSWWHPLPELVDVGRLVSEPYPEVEYFVHNMLARGDCALLAGPSGARKSWVTLDLAVAIATGQQIWGTGDEREPAPVLVVDMENHPDELHRRVHLIARAREIAPSDLQGQLLITPPCDGYSYRRDGTAARLARLVRHYRPALIILDSMTAISDIEDDNNAIMVRGFFSEHMYPLRQISGSTIIGVHHANKQADYGAKAPSDLSGWVRGSQDWKAAVDSMQFTMAVNDEDSRLIPVKTRRGPRGDALLIRLVRGQAGGMRPLCVGKGSDDQVSVLEVEMEICSFVSSSTHRCVSLPELAEHLERQLHLQDGRRMLQRRATPLVTGGRIRVGTYRQLFNEPDPTGVGGRGRPTTWYCTPDSQGLLKAPQEETS